MNYDHKIISRVGYNIFDLLSDLGGMHKVLSTIFGVITAVINFKHFETYLASYLYKINVYPKSKTSLTSFFKATERNNIKELCI